MAASDSGDSVPSVTAVPHKRKQRTRREVLVARHNEMMVKILLFLPVIPLLFVLLQWAWRPGLAWCNDGDSKLNEDPPSSCMEETVPWIPDAVTVTVVGIIYFVILLVAAVIVSSSGSLMRHGVRNKLTAVGVSIAVILSIIQMSVPPFFREVVLPLSARVNYTAVIQALDDDVSVTFQMLPKNISADAPDMDGWMLEVVQTPENYDGINQVNDLSPLATVAYRDDPDDISDQDSIISRVFSKDKLTAGKSYAWVVSPARKYEGGVHVVSQTYARFDGDLLNYQYFSLCKWDGDACEDCQRCRILGV